MTAVVRRRIEQLARERGIDFYAAASVVARRKRRRPAQERAAQLTRLRSTWAWRRDFLD